MHIDFANEELAFQENVKKFSRGISQGYSTQSYTDIPLEKMILENEKYFCL